MKILLGIPGSTAAGQGYEPADNIKQICDVIKNSTNYAGQTFSLLFSFSFVFNRCRCNDVGRR